MGFLSSDHNRKCILIFNSYDFHVCGRSSVGEWLVIPRKSLGSMPESLGQAFISVTLKDKAHLSHRTQFPVQRTPVCAVSFPILTWLALGLKPLMARLI